MLRNRWARLVAVAGAVLAGLAGAAYAYDSKRDDLIAKGVRVAGVDVGGLRASAAERKLTRTLTRALERPVTVRVAGHRFRLTAKRAHLIDDAPAMAEAAVERSRDGWMGGRVWREVTDGRLGADLPAQVRYSQVAVHRFVTPG